MNLIESSMADTFQVALKKSLFNDYESKELGQGQCATWKFDRSGENDPVVLWGDERPISAYIPVTSTAVEALNILLGAERDAIAKAQEELGGTSTLVITHRGPWSGGPVPDGDKWYCHRAVSFAVKPALTTTVA